MSIVLGYDESPGAKRALETAIDLARRFDEELVLVYGSAPPGGMGEEYRTYQEALAELGRAATAQAVEQAKAGGVEAVVEVVPEKPAQALIAVADRRDARMIVVGSYGESPIRSAVLGSTPHRLLQLSTRPVLCVPAERDEA